MTIDYREYTAQVEIDLENDRLVGKVIGIRDAIVFHAASVPELRKEMAASVDDYLKFCEERGREPAKPYSGRFSIRMDPDTHRQVDVAAASSGVSMNQWIAEAISTRLKRGGHLGEFDVLGQDVLFKYLGAVTKVRYSTHGVWLPGVQPHPPEDWQRGAPAHRISHMFTGEEA